MTAITILVCLIILVCTFRINGWAQEKKSMHKYAVGFIDRTGKVVIPPQFDSAEYFSEGLAAVEVGEKWGLIGKSGGEKWGFIDRSGNMVIQPQYDSVGWHGHFSEGLALVYVHGKCGFIDKTGKMVIQPQFDEANGEFADGLAGVVIGDREKGKIGFIDKTGRMVIQPQFAYGLSFSEGLAAVSVDGEKWGFIDKSGKFVIQPKFSQVNCFSGGLASVKFGSFYIRKKPLVRYPKGRAPQPLKGNEFGFIDKTGTTVIQYGFFWAGSFSDGLACVQFSDKFGFIDKTGKMIIQPQYEWADDFSEGLAWVRIGEKWGVIDKAGKVVIPPKFDYAGDVLEDEPWLFSEGLARSGAGYLDKTGKVVIQQARGSDFHEGLAAVLLETAK